MEPAAMGGCHPYTIRGGIATQVDSKKSIKPCKPSRSVKPGSHYRQQLVPSNFCSKPLQVMLALTKVGRHALYAKSPNCSRFLGTFCLMLGVGHIRRTLLSFWFSFHLLSMCLCFLDHREACMMKPEELGKKFWFPVSQQHQDLGQLQKFITALRVLHWTSSCFTLLYFQ